MLPTCNDVEIRIKENIGTKKYNNVTACHGKLLVSYHDKLDKNEFDKIFG